MIDFTAWVLQNTVYPDTTYHDFLCDMALTHDRIMEVGVHIGSSFIGMLRGKRRRTVATGIDMFLQNTEEEAYANLGLFEIDKKVKFLKLINGWDHLYLSQQLGIYQHTFVHLDADHSMEGTLCELYACHQAPSVQTIVVHDLIDERVEAAVENFRKWHHKDWKITMVGPELVFNGCIILERENS
jgi:hypothetical protein